MTLAFLLVVTAVVAAPGADFVVTLRNTVAHGRRAGIATAVGIGAASAIQGTLVALGLGALIVQSHVLFTAIKWLGIAYLVHLGVTSLWAAYRGAYAAAGDDYRPTGWWRGMRQGFLTNITNPKMLVFYLSLLPQFVSPTASTLTWLVHAWTLPALGTAWMVIVAVGGSMARDHLLRPVVRRVMDAVSGFALLGFGLKLATARD
ncbi:LysE family translocator [Mariniluteicoccus flavus]